MSQIERTGWHFEDAGLTRTERRAIRRQVRAGQAIVKGEEVSNKPSLPEPSPTDLVELIEARR